MRVLFGLTQLYRQTDKNATRGTAKLDLLQECELMKCLQFLWCGEYTLRIIGLYRSLKK